MKAKVRRVRSILKRRLILSMTTDVLWGDHTPGFLTHPIHNDIMLHCLQAIPNNLPSYMSVKFLPSSSGVLLS